MTEPTISRDIPKKTEDIWIALESPREVLVVTPAYRLQVTGTPWDEYEWFVHKDLRWPIWGVSERSGLAVPDSGGASPEDAIAAAEGVMRKEARHLSPERIRRYLDRARKQTANLPRETAQNAPAGL